jgi:hypothetical protein
MDTLEGAGQLLAVAAQIREERFVHLLHLSGGKEFGCFLAALRLPDNSPKENAPRWRGKPPPTAKRQPVPSLNPVEA